MFVFLLTILIVLGVLLMVVVLLQAGKGGGLAAMGGGMASPDTFMGGRQAATVLTKATWIGGGIFLGLSLILSVMSSRAQQPASILQDEFRQTAPVAPQPVLPQGLQPAQPEAGSGGAAAPAADPDPGS